MLVSVVQIGNSRGVRLPKAILDQLEVADNKLDLEVENGQIILRRVPRQPRDGWDAAFKQMSAENEEIQLVSQELDPKGLDWEW